MPVHATKAYGRSRGINPLILNLGARWCWVVNFKPQPLYLWERTPVTTEEARWAPELFWTTEIRTLDQPDRCQVTVPTELLRVITLY
jgi:hypothetical protein